MAEYIKQNRIIALDMLVPHPRNYRIHPKHQIDQLTLSLQRFGQGRSIVVQDSPERMIIVAGHGIVEAAQALQWQELRADILPADWTDQQIEGYLIADNLHSQEASDNEELLAMLLQEQLDAGFDLRSLGTDDETLRQMLEAMGDGYLSGDESTTEEDDFDTTPDETQTRCKPGDIWKLGRHKIGCLDSTDVEQMKRLFTDAIPHMVWSDPPYGINLLEKRGKIGLSREYEPILNDGDTQTAIKAFKLIYGYWAQPVHIWWGANYYADSLPASSCWIIWDKDHHGMTYADAELAWVNRDEPARCFRHAWSGAHRDSERGEERTHPNQKPVALAVWFFEKYGKERDVIYDPFLGSGMSIIAAERLNRAVYGCELSPNFLDVCIRRWEAETGQTAELLAEVSHA